MLHFARPFAAALLAACCSAPALAHVTLEYPVAHAGRSYKAVFKVGHGCGDSPTRRVVVEIPAGVRSARPMPKPGWALDVQRAPLPQPETNHGRTVTDDVVRITWTASTAEDMLPNAHYDEFVLQASLPATAGTLYWPVRQVCLQGQNDWVQVPQPGQSAHDLKSPAAALELLPASGGHQH